MRRPLVVAAVATLVALLGSSGAQAGFPYEGPGHAGRIPLGDGGHSVGLGATVGDNRTLITLTGLPAGLCGIDLDEGPGYGETRVTWTNGSSEAHIWAEAGAVDAPFRVRAHWLTDLHGACTAEVTEDGIVWHDPRGRPFVELGVNDTLMFWSGPVGSVFPLSVDVHNNGTLPARVSAAFRVAQDGWEIRDATPLVDVEVGPLKTVRFGIELFVPRSEKPRMNVVPVTLTSADWKAGPQFMIDLQDALPLAPTEGAPATEDGLEEWEPTPREAPAPTWVGVLSAFAVVAALARRTITSGAHRRRR